MFIALRRVQSNGAVKLTNSATALELVCTFNASYFRSSGITGVRCSQLTFDTLDGLLSVILNDTTEIRSGPECSSDRAASKRRSRRTMDVITKNVPAGYAVDTPEKSHMKHWLLGCALALNAGACSHFAEPDALPAAQTLAEFESQLDGLRRQLSIPGMSAIVMVHDKTVWEGSLGFADIPSQRPVTPTTQFHLASLTKTFASTIVLQLVEQGLVKLDHPISSYGLNLPGPDTIRVRHLLSHTSEGVPGAEFRYNGDRFALLDQVIQRATGESFAKRAMDRIVRPLALDQTAPNPLNTAAFAASGHEAATYIAAMATGYGIDNNERPVRVAYPVSFSSAAGLVSTAREVARYSTALDAGQFLSASTRTLAYTPSRGADNRILPYGLGWFVSMVNGHTLVWHYGYWTGNSSLIIKEPSRGLTFVALTNSDQLSARFRLGAGDLMSSTIAQVFVNAFVVGSLGRQQ